MDDYLRTYRQFKKCNNLVQHHKKKRIRKKNIGRQFVKCCNLSMYHKSIRIRKKNANRICKLLDRLPDVITTAFL